MGIDTRPPAWYNSDSNINMIKSEERNEMREDVKRIMDRVRKLLAMAKDGSSPHEASIAANRARKLMDAWQLSEDDISDVSDFSVNSIGKERKYTPKWEQQIAIAIAKYNDCIVGFSRATLISHLKLEFRGYRADVELCEVMFDYLVANGCRACQINLPTKLYNPTVGTNFKNAYAAEITRRFSELSIERQKGFAVSTSGSLMLRKADTVAQQFSKGRYKTNNVKLSDDPEHIRARELGYKAGTLAQLHLGLDETKKL